jgi:hypothetical protein
MFLYTSYLRELAHRCVRLAHSCSDRIISHELEAISVELMEKAAEIPTGIAAAPTSSTSATTTVTRDPLLTLLRRCEAGLAVFDRATESDRTAEEEDQIAKETWYSTKEQILEQQPPATTAAGALLALDHVLKNDDLAAERTESEGMQMLWLLVKAARDYLAAMEGRVISVASDQPLDS